jgi:peptidyl-prolyl cis-trans isomerase D
MALAFLRRHRKWFNWFLVVVIASFIYFYIPAFQGGEAGTQSEALATVGGLPITVGEFQRAYVAQRQQLERMSQRRLDEATLRSFNLEQRVLEGLVSDRLMTLEAQRLGLSVDDATVAREITRMPELQDNGRFVGAAEYRRRLEMGGGTPQEFEQSVRGSLLRTRLEALVASGAGASIADAEREFRKRNERVTVEYALVDAARFKSGVAADDAEAQARFEADREAYRVPEKRVLGFALVDAAALEARVTVTDRDLEAYYQERQDDFRQEEQACASHILIKVKSQGNAEGHSDDEARRIASGLLEELARGGDFSALAKRSSEDPGSASTGGDLSCFPRGRMVPEFDNAAFSLSPGETSDLVRTPYGYHIIRLASRRDESVMPLSQVKERVRRIVLNRRVEALAEEAARELGEALRKGRSLEEAAKAQGLAVQKSAPLARGETLPPLDSARLVARAFELKPGELEREAFPVSRGLAFIQLAEVQAPRLPELKEVMERVKADVLEQKALAAARSKAGELKAGAERQGLEKAAVALGLVRKQTPSPVGRGEPLGDLGASLGLDELVYSLPLKTLSAPVRVPSGFAVLRVLERSAFDPVEFEKQKAPLLASLREQRRSELFQAYLAQLRQRTPMTRNAEAMRRVSSR